MRIRSKLTGGVVTVSEEVGATLLTLSTWESADTPKPQPVAEPKRRRRRASEKPVEVDNDGE
ncbi:hypothetical protein PBI_PHANTASTIC_16 [Mycobacterium phage Phantastic]|uniref:Head-to-tail connector protein n=1 Tax=Mycobacterium phage Phantastic TaxID=1486426 RepID=A0A023W6V6_9CAUD|nr:head-tail connector protein [Mycobacterium phage Phantastic]AHY27079.1 hypothetical protein PBI_PHANTASTIC_16 [Mycobacterium phage Phantastic]